VNIRFIFQQLEQNSRAVVELVRDMDSEQARWKPTPNDWSVREVIGHLMDEEREDFRFRIQHLWAGSGKPWPENFQGDWPHERAYNLRDLDELVNEFQMERARSLGWLERLENPDWDQRYFHPPLEGISAGDICAAWAAHDLLHLRQLVELKWAYGQKQSAPYSIRYAGDW